MSHDMLQLRCGQSTSGSAAVRVSASMYVASHSRSHCVFVISPSAHISRNCSTVCDASVVETYASTAAFSAPLSASTHSSRLPTRSGCGCILTLPSCSSCESRAASRPSVVCTSCPLGTLRGCTCGRARNLDCCTRRLPTSVVYMSGTELPSWPLLGLLYVVLYRWYAEFMLSTPTSDGSSCRPCGP